MASLQRRETPGVASEAFDASNQRMPDPWQGQCAAPVLSRMAAGELSARPLPCRLA
jgi:hypothetical protein